MNSQGYIRSQDVYSALLKSPCSGSDILGLNVSGHTSEQSDSLTSLEVRDT